MYFLSLVLHLTAFGFIQAIFYMDKNCNTTNNNGILYHNCLIQENQYWNLTEFRDWTLSMRSNQTVVVNIQCTKNGLINLKRPIKAKGLEKLRITNCDILDALKYNFSNVVINMDYSIKEYTLINCTFLIRPDKRNKSLLKKYRDKINLHYRCRIPESTKRFIETGCKLRAYGSPWIFDKNEIKILEEHIESLTREREQCTYMNLQYYEKTRNVYSGTFLSKANENDISDFMSSSKFPNIEVFNFSRQGLTKIDENLYRNRWWIYLSNLKILDLSFNNMTHIDFQYKKSRIHQTVLTVNLTNNKITNINGKDLQNIKSFYPNFILLQNNPFDCTCDLVRVMQILRLEHKQDWASSYKYLMDLYCTDKNSNNHKKKLNELKEEDLCRDNFSYLSLLLVVGSVSFCVVTFLILIPCITKSQIYRRNQNSHGTSQIYRRNHNAINTLTLQPKSSSTIVKEYDAFISYSSKDENWVVNVLCKRLESSPHNLSLCLHYKHFVPGACIADNIIDSVEKSRRTILVLSNNFLRSEWCILEFRKAFHQSLLENSHLVILILDEDLDFNDIPDLKHCLMTRTYIRVNESLFWDKLIQCLSKASSNRGNKSLQNGYSKNLSNSSTKRKDQSTFLP